MTTGLYGGIQIAQGQDEITHGGSLSEVVIPPNNES